MFFEILTLFPGMFHSFFRAGLIGRGVRNGTFGYRLLNLRSFGEGKYRSVDDYPFSGNPGLLLKYNVLKAARENAGEGKTICLTPRGRVLNQKLVTELSREKSLVMVCGHYEGMDQRFINKHADMEISIGDYVLGGGELAAMVLVETISRKLEHYLGNELSGEDESFEKGILEYDQYTRPRESDSLQVPGVLLSGHAAKIQAWMRSNALTCTHQRRPELLRREPLTAADVKSLWQGIRDLKGEKNESTNEES